MQKRFMVLAICLFTLSTVAQVSLSKVMYERKMNMHKRMSPEAEQIRAMIPEFNISKAQLLFNGDGSIFKTLPQVEELKKL